ncbi:putative ring finger domain protein [Botrytis fragariae]|uniref:Putative ring finger domain protein n=1 Tax=Botrytis fragariae TaxID=1964551 RepID=A0A8H6ALQ9_9HELO|nr:putative ring finger domain protein [Botrytis fragariae]KAF5869689.1 putative ring finger domain protein [Botrytis fragariae]
MSSQSSRMSRSSNSTAVSSSSSTTPSMDIDTRLAPLPETRKRSRNSDLDSDDEEPQAQRVRAGDSNSIDNIESGMAIDAPARSVMAPTHSRQSRIRSGRSTMSRQEQEQISSTFANIGAPSQTPAQSVLVSSPSRANHTVQASTTRQSPESTPQSRLYEEISDYDADTSGDERPSKVRRRGEGQNSVHTRAGPVETWNSGAIAPPASNEASVVEHQGSETASSPVSSLLLAIEAPSNQNALMRRDTPYIDLTWEDSSDEEENDAALPPAPSVLPAVAAPPVQNSQPNAAPKFVSLMFDDSSDEEESAATMSKAYIGDRIVLVEEKRLEPFLPEPTVKFQRLLEDAQTQKLHCLDKWYSVGYEDDVEFSRQFAVLGTSCNVYVVIIGKRPNCNCYEGNRGILCVHIVFILTQFLNLPAPLRHQSAFLEAELRCMMGDEIDWMGPVSTDKFCTQKSVEEQETCSICLENLEGDGSITWCRGQCGQNFHLQCIWTWADTNFRDGQPDITCGNCRAPWIWIGRQLAGLIEGVWNWQFGIHDDDAGYRSLSKLLDRDVSKEGYFNVAELLGIYETVDDDAEARQRYQRVVDRWRVEMVRRPTTLLEEVYDFIVRYHPEVYSDVDDVFSDESIDEDNPRAIRLLETVDFVETNVERVLQGLPTIDSEYTRDLHLL